MFSVSPIEVGLILGGLVVILLLACLGQRTWRWAAVALACVTVAALMTPADPLSTIVCSVAFFVFFVGGTRFNRQSLMSAA